MSKILEKIDMSKILDIISNISRKKSKIQNTVPQIHKILYRELSFQLPSFFLEENICTIRIFRNLSISGKYSQNLSSLVKNFSNFYILTKKIT